MLRTIRCFLGLVRLLFWNASCDSLRSWWLYRSSSRNASCDPVPVWSDSNILGGGFKQFVDFLVLPCPSSGSRLSPTMAAISANSSRRVDTQERFVWFPKGPPLRTRKHESYQSTALKLLFLFSPSNKLFGPQGGPSPNVWLSAGRQGPHGYDTRQKLKPQAH